MQPVRAILTIIAASGLGLLIPVAGLAQVPDGLEDMTLEQRREYVQSLSGEEQQALREQLRAKWDGMSEEERQAARSKQSERRNANREAMRQQWESMSDEERAAARAKRDTQKQKQRERWDNLSDEEKAAARERNRDNGKGQGGRDRQQNGRDAQGQRQP